VPAAEQVAEEHLEVPAHGLQRLGEQPPAVGVDLVDDLLQRAFGGGQVLVLGREVLVAGLELFELVEGFEVDIAQVIDLPPQVVDFRLDLLAAPLLLLGRLVLPLGKLDAVVLAEPVGQGGPL
jgi:hypothetical protein